MDLGAISLCRWTPSKHTNPQMQRTVNVLPRPCLSAMVTPCVQGLSNPNWNLSTNPAPGHTVCIETICLAPDTGFFVLISIELKHPCRTAEAPTACTCTVAAASSWLLLSNSARECASCVPATDPSMGSLRLKKNNSPSFPRSQCKGCPSYPQTVIHDVDHANCSTQLWLWPSVTCGRFPVPHPHPHPSNHFLLLCHGLLPVTMQTFKSSGSVGWFCRFCGML